MGVAALILAAGSGSRMKMNTTKQKIVLNGQSVLLRTVSVFDSSDIVDSITVVVRSEEVDFAKQELSGIGKLHKIVVGGDTRLKSVKNGILHIPDISQYVAIHDAARCLITHGMIKLVYEDAVKYGAATASTSVTDTIKQIGIDGNILNTVDRSQLVSVQTPQIFKLDKYIKALSLVDDDDKTITDDNMVFERAGFSVHPTETGKNNIKITVPEDLKYAEFLLNGGSDHV